MKKIIVTTDLSETSYIAFPTARKLTRKFDSELILLAVIEDPDTMALRYAMTHEINPGEDVQQQLISNITEKLQTLVDEHFSECKVSCQVVEAEGSAHSTILSFADRVKADTIVLASHGRSKLKRILIGSIAEKVIRESTVPVVIVPARPQKESSLSSKLQSIVLKSNNE